MREAVAILDTSNRRGRRDDAAAWWRSIAADMPDHVREAVQKSLLKRAGRIEECSQASWLRTYDGKPERWCEARCNDRHCDTCWAMGAARREREVRAVVERLDKEGFCVVPVTLTFRPKKWANPRREVEVCLDIWRATRQRKATRKSSCQVGGWRRLEATWRSPKPNKKGKRPLRPLVHLHVPVIMPKGADIEDLKTELVSVWRDECKKRSRYAAASAQDVRHAQDVAGACKYFLKYIAKPVDMRDGALAGIAAWAFRRKRLIDAWGACHAGSLRGKNPHPVAIMVAEVLAEVREERARYGRATLGDLWDGDKGFDPDAWAVDVMPAELVARALPGCGEWKRREYREATFLEKAKISRTLPVTPEALRFLHLVGMPLEEHWRDLLEIWTRQKAPPDT